MNFFELSQKARARKKKRQSKITSMKQTISSFIHSYRQLILGLLAWIIILGLLGWGISFFFDEGSWGARLLMLASISFVLGVFLIEDKKKERKEENPYFLDPNGHDWTSSYDPDDIVGYLEEDQERAIQALIGPGTSFAITLEELTRLNANAKLHLAELDKRCDKPLIELYREGKRELDRRRGVYATSAEESLGILEPVWNEPEFPVGCEPTFPGFEARPHPILTPRIAPEQAIVNELSTLVSTDNVKRIRDHMKAHVKRTNRIIGELKSLREKVDAMRKHGELRTIAVIIALRDRVAAQKSVHIEGSLIEMSNKADQTIVQVVTELEMYFRDMQRQFEERLPSAEQRKNLADPNLVSVQELIEIETGVMGLVNIPELPEIDPSRLELLEPELI